MVVPYYVEQPALVLRHLQRQTLSTNSPRTRFRLGPPSCRVRSRNVHVFMRCSDSKTSPGTAFRHELAREFEHVPQCEVRVIPRRFSYLSASEAQDAFLATTEYMIRSRFCLVPLGITASSRRRDKH